jgi:DNA-binding phage protein
MSDVKSNRNHLRQRAAAVGIFTLSDLARKVGCSRTAMYLAVERPSRFPKVHSRLNKILTLK